jgi:hypothetical protein
MFKLFFLNKQSLVAQIVRYFAQDQGESAELIRISEHFLTQRLGEIAHKVGN